MGQVYGAAADGTDQGETTLAGDLVEIVASFGRAVVDTIKALPGLVGINLSNEDAPSEPGLAAVLRASFDASSGGQAAAAGLAFMVFVLLYTPCMAAVAAERHELGTKWAVLSLIGQLILAWGMAFLVFRAGVWLGGG
jgi:ferrous iron transport protein B